MLKVKRPSQVAKPIIQKILFMCTGNSCRTQMAEGFVRKLKGNILEPHSAGLKKQKIDPRAVKVMAEVGIDISKQQSKLVSDLTRIDFDIVITICDDANEKYHLFLGKAKKYGHAFDNPPFLAEMLTREDEILAIYRRVQDEIKNFVDRMPDSLASD